MFKGFSAFRKSGRLAVMSVLLGVVAACTPGGVGGPSISTSAPVPVALLVPFGSEGAGETKLAQSLENAARLAIADLDGVKIDLRVYGTAGDSNQAAAQATKAVSEGAKIILGPVFGEAANAAGLVAARSGVNVLSFSNNTAVAGGNVFVLGNTFQNTAEHVLRFAAGQGNDKIVVVHANNPTGNVASSSVNAAVGATRGISSVGTISYEPSQEGVIASVPVIADTIRNNGANGVFITSDTLGGLPVLSQLLSENRIKPAEFQFMGLTRWDIPAQTLVLPGVQNGIFALPDPSLTSRFDARYKQAFGDNPHPIAGLAYDGIAAIGALVKTAGSSALTHGSLTQNSGFAGVNGVFRLRPDGSNQRALAVARIVNRQVTIVSPAPTSFGSAGF